MRLSICFSTTNAFYSKIIRWLTGGSASHVYIRFFDQTLGTEMILHSDMPGVVFNLAEEFKIKNFTIEEYEIDDPRLDQAVKNNLWFLGKSYDYYKLINWAWIIIFKRWFVRKIKDPSKDPKKIVCVDYVLYIFNEAGITCLPIGYLTPADLLSWCRENYNNLGWKQKIFDNTPEWLR